MKIGMVTALFILFLTLPVCAAKPHVEMALVQCRLKLAGYDPGPIDGLYGQKTVQAVQRFRRKQGLRTNNPLSWYHVLLGLTEGQLYKCQAPLEEIVEKAQRIAQMTDKESGTMLVRDLSNISTGMEPDSEAQVRELFDIIDVTASNGDTHIEISKDND